MTTERFEELQKKFPGYVLEEVNLSEMPLPKEWDIKIEQYAANHDLSYDQAKVEMEKNLLNFGVPGQLLILLMELLILHIKTLLLKININLHL